MHVQSGKYVHPLGGAPGDNIKLVIHSGGANEDKTKFLVTAKGSLQHKSGQFVHLEGGKSVHKDNHLVFHSGTDGLFQTQFILNQDGTLQHTPSRKFVHLMGTNRPKNEYEANNNPLVIHEDYPTKTTFKFIEEHVSG